jgi:hypothetical protein
MRCGSAAGLALTSAARRAALRARKPASPSSSLKKASTRAAAARWRGAAAEAPLSELATSSSSLPLPLPLPSSDSQPLPSLPSSEGSLALPRSDAPPPPPRSDAPSPSAAGGARKTARSSTRCVRLARASQRREAGEACAPRVSSRRSGTARTARYQCLLTRANFSQQRTNSETSPPSIASDAMTERTSAGSAPQSGAAALKAAPAGAALLTAAPPAPTASASASAVAGAIARRGAASALGRRAKSLCDSGESQRRSSTQKPLVQRARRGH